MKMWRHSKYRRNWRTLKSLIKSHALAVTCIRYNWEGDSVRGTGEDVCRHPNSGTRVGVAKWHKRHTSLPLWLEDAHSGEHQPEVTEAIFVLATSVSRHKCEMENTGVVFSQWVRQTPPITHKAADMHEVYPPRKKKKKGAPANLARTCWNYCYVHLLKEITRYIEVRLCKSAFWLLIRKCIAYKNEASR